MDAYATVLNMLSRMDTYDPDELLTSAQVQRLANISKSTVSRAVKDGRLKPLRTPGGHFRFRRSDVEKLLTAEAAS